LHFTKKQNNFPFTPHVAFHEKQKQFSIHTICCISRKKQRSMRKIVFPSNIK
jgi:hypothetical protein